MEKYTVDYFIDKFSKIPINLWSTGKFEEYDKHCAYGHCGAKSFEDIHNRSQKSPEIDALFNLFRNNLNVGVISINDKPGINHYNFPTPKERILAALYDIKAKLQSKEEVKERTVYVTVDKEVRELQKVEELIEN